jgi:hypothetical protein
MRYNEAHVPRASPFVPETSAPRAATLHRTISDEDIMRTAPDLPEPSNAPVEARL